LSNGSPRRVYSGMARLSAAQASRSASQGNSVVSLTFFLAEPGSPNGRSQTSSAREYLRVHKVGAPFALPSCTLQKLRCMSLNLAHRVVCAEQQHAATSAEIMDSVD
jgi:hypothetical protein